MAWTVEFSRWAEWDLGHISDHLYNSHLAFGLDAALAIPRAPHRGTLRPEYGAGVRTLTVEKAVYWFTLDEAAERVQILAIFYGGQDHMRHMLIRMLGEIDT